MWAFQRASWCTYYHGNLKKKHAHNHDCMYVCIYIYAMMELTIALQSTVRDVVSCWSLSEVVGLQRTKYVDLHTS